MSWLFYGIVELLGIYSAYRAIMETRTAQGAVAWAIFLVSMPLAALPAYWIFGRSRFIGYKNARQIKDDYVHRSLADLSERLSSFRVTPVSAHDIDVVKTGITTLPALRGNSAELLIDGEATFSSIMQGIVTARSYVLFQFYIIKDDGIGTRLKELLCRKAREGVSVSFLYDEIGSHALGEGYLDDLRRAGVRVSAFNTTRGRGNRFQLNFRNHRKLVVTDGHSAWLGGHNVGDEYLGRDEKFGRWRDTHLHISGPAVMAAQLSFVEDWYWATGDLAGDLCWEARTPSQADLPVLVLPTGPADRLETAGLAFSYFISRAEKRIWIASPYFVPDDATMAALQLAGLRGLDVRILIPERPDHRLVYLAAFAYIHEAALAGVRFFRYTQGFMHQKVLLIDDDTSAIGTANFDNRSFRLNFEITAVITDRDFARQTERMLEEDFRHSREMSSEDSAAKPPWFRFSARAARLAAPLL